ncbi:MAG: peroxiredoxin [Sphaerochaetaceae bacterium]|jgi:peroxiredoxin Q/BCP|nr:peroxiredoxin [Sphaerochaetaceae bacterium]MDX9810424.1 peroxiredoxin [Sphaerochaetaceae bacterium]NLV83536.1 peroxiredoxin [Spirochaetales bacterium]
MLATGSKIPDTALLDENGSVLRLTDYAGSYVVLYVYPKDDTPGCTAEACSFRDQSSAITAFKAVIIGISPDSPTSHKKFKEKYHLNFTLASDEEKTVITQLGAWGEKTSYGKTTVGVIRSTFLFGPDGTLIKVWPKVSPATHGEEIAAELAQISK